MIKRILITGSKGFVGTNLIELCKREKIFTVPFDPQTEEWNIEVYKRELDLATRDQKIDAVVHLGALASTRILDKERLYGFNHHATTIIANYCMKTDIPLTFVSTSAIYGNAENVLSEYAKSKLMSENYLNSNKLLRSITIRLFNTYGFNELGKKSMKSVVSDMIISALTRNVIEIWQLPNLETGQQARDFIWVRNVAETLLRVTLEQKLNSQAVDLGSGQSVNFAHIANLIKNEIVNSRIVTLQVPSDYDTTNYQTFTKANIDWLPSSMKESTFARVEETIPNLIFQYKKLLNL